MSGSICRFAGFTYSAQKGLQRNGVQIHLGPQARQLLELLLETKGGVVSKAEIAARLWPDRPPSDDSIDRCAYLLRKPLREAGFGDLIATAYGRGLSLRATVELLAADEDAPPKSTVSARVLELWQTAYELAGTRTRDGFARAQAATAAAIELDPSSPAVWSLSGDIAAWRVVRGYLPAPDALALIERQTCQALELLPDFPPALAALGWARTVMAARADEGLSMLDRAVAQDRRYAKARAYRGWALVHVGRLEEAFEDSETGLQDSPLNQSLLTLRAWLAICVGDIDRCEELARRGLELRPDANGLRGIAAILASFRGRHEEAIEMSDQSLRLAPDDPVMLSMKAYVLAKAERPIEAEEALSLVKGAGNAPPSTFVAAANLALGRPEEAVSALRRGRQDGCPWLSFAPYDPRLRPLAAEIASLRAGVPGSPGG
ncbi:MAG: transcriptional regulator [Methylocystis sp.]|nr:MAG: transcriptional regulator [Methylocystis sp.]